MITQSNHPLRVLIIDDDEDDYYLTSDLLKQIPNASFGIDWSYNYADAMEQCLLHQHQVYIVDYRLGAKTGTDFIAEARAAGNEEPIILLTGKGSREIDLEALRIGATDYLIKGELTVDKLERCIRYSIERVNATKAIRSSENKYRTIFEQSKDSIFIANAQFELLDVNKAFCQMLSKQPCDLKNTSFYDYLLPEQAEQIKEKFNRTGVLTDELIEIEVEGEEDKDCLMSISPQPAGDGSLLFQGIIHDITNLKKAERANLQMEKLAAAGRLVRTLAHEVRNPLNNINMSVEQLIDQLDTDDEGKLYLDIVRRNSLRISSLIKELLTSSRPTEMNMEQLEIKEVIQGVVADAIDRITLKQINFTQRLPSELAYLNGDAEKLKIALLNILINAVEAVQERTGLIELEVQLSVDQMLVIISDNGVGISQENKAKLFEPYFTSKRNGMGLGLAATLNIVQAHNGSIEVQSELGSGTQFQVRFPRLVG